MRAKEFFIVEYDRNKTQANYGSKIVAVARRDRTIPSDFRDPGRVADEQLADIVLNAIEGSDPTKNKEYAQALANLYSKGGIKFEDMGSTVADYLAKFHKLKNKRMIPSPRNDFMRYTDIGDFFSVVDEYPNPSEKSQTDRGQANEVYKDSDIRIIVPQDQTAACYYGQGTRWCTASQNNNMFSRYNSEGPMYIILPLRPAYPGEKYQFHFPSKQFMNEQDRQANISELIKRWPQLGKIFAEQAQKYNVLSFIYSPEELSAMIEKSLPTFVREVSDTLVQNASKLGKTLGKGIVDEIRPLRDFKEEVGTLAVDAYKESGPLLAKMIASLIRQNPDIVYDDDLLYDELSNELHEWMRSTELWLWATEYFEEIEDEDSEFDFAMTYEGEVSMVLRNLIPEIFGKTLQGQK